MRRFTQDACGAESVIGHGGQLKVTAIAQETPHILAHALLYDTFFT
jgi:hypothetical protein